MRYRVTLRREREEVACILVELSGIDHPMGASDARAMVDKRERERDAEAQRPFLPAEEIEVKGAEMGDAPRKRRGVAWVRPFVEFVMAGTILLLLLTRWRGGERERPSPVPNCMAPPRWTCLFVCSRRG